MSIILYSFSFKVLEHDMSFSKTSTSGSGHSSGYGSKVRKIVFNVYSFFKKCLKKNEADWISLNTRIIQPKRAV
jgi:hypothetical protein